MNSKYQFLFWRPVTAIDPTAVIADGFGPVPGFDDENERTVEETGWRPLITTPNHPEYPGAHGSITSAMAEVLGEFLGTEQIDVDIHGFDATGTTGNLDAVRHFDSTERLRSEIIEARLWAGLHYRGSSEAGVDLGRKVARYDLNHAFRTRAASAKVRIPRIRSDSTMTALIAQASERSATFRRFVNLIDATDGIVYLERGRCRYKMRACLLATVTMAGPNRILRIMIDQRQAECDLNQMASIGHELWHAIEVLREPSIRSDSAFFFFYLREGLHTNRLEYPLGAWETPAADKAGVDVLAELRKGSPEKGEPCAHR